jgi:[acyl-carrier-protein] S-malonyltransferase
MGREFHDAIAAAQELFELGSRLVGFDLARACFQGSGEELGQTRIAQPALLAVDLAAFAALSEKGIQPAMVAGHSLGEFAAWVASGALEAKEAFRLVRRRAELMEEAGEKAPGGMVAVLGLSEERVRALCERAGERGVVVAANLNAPGEIVVSGEMEALEVVKELAREQGGRGLPLRVSGAFHSPLMEPAAEEFRREVERVEVKEARIPVVTNAGAEPACSAEEVREAMGRQMASPVRWEASVRRMVAAGLEVFIEPGVGEVLTKLVKRTAPEVEAFAVNDMRSLQRVEAC